MNPDEIAVLTAAPCRGKVLVRQRSAVAYRRLRVQQMQESRTRIASTRVVDEIDRARAQEYALLATLLSRSPDAQMIQRLAMLRGDASAIGVAHAAGPLVEFANFHAQEQQVAVRPEINSVMEGLRFDRDGIFRRLAVPVSSGCIPLAHDTA